MVDTVIAAQLYTLREYLKTPADIAGTLKKVAEIGYKAVQVSGMGYIEPIELKKIVDAEGLQICATHISYDRMCKETQAVIDEHKLWNCKYVGLGSMPGDYRKSAESYSRFAKEASEIAKRFADQGLSFVYHDHNFEFTRFGDRLGMDILYSESDPKYFNAEIDTYWVQAGGADPAAWIHKLKDRMEIIHFKDMTVDTDGKQLMAEVGEGNLNWPSILEACKEAGIRWYIVEQDVCQRDPFESLAISLRNLKAMGLE